MIVQLDDRPSAWGYPPVRGMVLVPDRGDVIEHEGVEHFVIRSNDGEVVATVDGNEESAGFGLRQSCTCDGLFLTANRCERDGYRVEQIGFDQFDVPGRRRWRVIRGAGPSEQEG